MARKRTGLKPGHYKRERGGDNVFNNGAEGSYRDYSFPVWNSDVDSNETGAPFIRSIPFYIVVGNHDTGATGVNANMLGNDTAGRFSGNTDGGDALAYFNNYYFPLNGPTSVDTQFIWNGDKHRRGFRIALRREWDAIKSREFSLIASHFYSYSERSLYPVCAGAVCSPTEQSIACLAGLRRGRGN